MALKGQQEQLLYLLLLPSSQHEQTIHHAAKQTAGPLWLPPLHYTHAPCRAHTDIHMPTISAASTRHMHVLSNAGLICVNVTRSSKCTKLLDSISTITHNGEHCHTPHTCQKRPAVPDPGAGPGAERPAASQCHLSTCTQHPQSQLGVKNLYEQRCRPAGCTGSEPGITSVKQSRGSRVQQPRGMRCTP